MDSTKSDVIDKILALSRKEPTVTSIVNHYAEENNMTYLEAIQNFTNDITIDIIDKQIKFRLETEEMLKMVISTDKRNLNVY